MGRPDRHRADTARLPLGLVAAALLGLGLVPAAGALAQGPAWPTRAVRVVVPFPPGAGVDIVTRVVAPRLAESLGQQFVPDNRAGAGGAVGAEVAAKAAPDGYTLLMGTAGVLTVLPIMSKPGYDVARDFVPVSLVASVPSLLVVHPSMPVRTLKDLVALARAKPGAINYASTGAGTLPHLAAELLRQQAKIDIVHIPYKGSAPAMTDLMGGQVEMFFGNMLSVVPQVRAGKLRAIAATSPERSPAAPDVPTVSESGYPGFEASTWFGLLAPTGTPAAIVERLQGEVARSLRHPDVRQSLAGQGAQPIGSTPAAFGAYIRTETAKWARVLKSSGLRVD